MKLFSIIILVINALIHIYFGGVFIFNPEPMMESLSIASTSPTGLVEMRTFYGGFMMAIGLYYLVSAFISGLRMPALFFAVLTYGAAICTRTYGMVVDDQLSSSILQKILIVEVAGLILSFAALLFVRKKDEVRT